MSVMEGLTIELARLEICSFSLEFSGVIPRPYGAGALPEPQIQLDLKLTVRNFRRVGYHFASRSSHAKPYFREIGPSFYIQRLPSKDWSLDFGEVISMPDDLKLTLYAACAETPALSSMLVHITSIRIFL
ncbi:MAG: hypothetical protein HPY66_3043 [Firmicutes bacterium]|nr:hypothetical protein [Bacillota bacterium]